MAKVIEAQAPEMQKFLDQGEFLNIPKEGDVISGKVITASRREVRIDIAGYSTGVVRGREMFAESLEYSSLKPGEEVEATVIDMENENGEMELSFRFAGQKKAWEELRKLFTSGEVIDVKILEANKGGLIVRLQHVTGFLPVSQLSPEHYPRVSGGDKNKILDRLKSYVGDDFKVRVLDADENDEKLIVSEKAVWEEEQKNVIAKFEVGNIIEGEVTAVADFGAFVKFDSLEGLVHISEIAWQRIDHPRDLLKLGQTVKAKIIGIEGSKIFLSMKDLVDDPWTNITARYNVGDLVKGTVLKVNPFGFFVELDPEIHGLAHVSELSDKPVVDVKEIGKPGEILEFRIVSIEPNEHRLGLSLKAIKDWKPGDEKKEPVEEVKSVEEKVKEVVEETEVVEEEKKSGGAGSGSAGEETTKEPEAE